MTTSDQDVTAWFDQFPDAPGWEHLQWCARHWAPCPILGANGVGAVVELMEVFITEVVPDAKGADSMNARMDAAGKMCCTLGDERMYEIWGHWPPSSGQTPDAVVQLDGGGP